MTQGTNKFGGFTLIELLLVIAILGILSSISLASFITSINKGRDSQRKSDIATLSKALDTFKSDFGVYPDQGPANEIMGCMSATNGPFVDCGTGTSFHYYKNSEEIVLITKYPTDPVGGKIYRYEHSDATGSSDETYSLYAALENSNDKDVKKQADGSVDPAGWGVACGSATCNYKVTETGLITK